MTRLHANFAQRVNTMRNSTARILLGCVLALFTFAGSATAQNATTTGQIRGTVTDPAGAPIVGANIVARNTATGQERGVLTERGGVYTIRLLPPGTYTVRTQMIGMAPMTTPDIRVAIGQTSTANFQLATQAV